MKKRIFKEGSEFLSRLQALSQGNMMPVLAEEQEARVAYSISTKEELNAVRNDLSGDYTLMNDITFTAADFQSGGAFYNDGQGWTPIGNSLDQPFTGTFNGNGRTIFGLQVNVTRTEENDRTAVFAGLFGVNAGNVSNLTMRDGSINIDSSLSVGPETTPDDSPIGNPILDPLGGGHFAGGIAGCNVVGGITSCTNFNTVRITLHDIDSYNVSVQAPGFEYFYSYALAYAYAGGLAGCNLGVILNSINRGNVTVNSSNVSSHNDEVTGNNPAIAYGYAYAYNFAFAGGITGYNYSGSFVSNCRNFGAITGTLNNTSAVVGSNVVSYFGNWSYTYAYSYAFVAGIAGYNAGTVNLGCVNEGPVTGTSTEVAANTYSDFVGYAYAYAYAYAGGMVGLNNFGIGILGNVNNSFNAARGIINATSRDAVAQVTGTGLDRFTFAFVYAYAGGTVGYNVSSITQAYSTGTAAATATNASGSALTGGFAGNLVGANFGTITTGAWLIGRTPGRGVGNSALFPIGSTSLLMLTYAAYFGGIEQVLP